LGIICLWQVVAENEAALRHHVPLSSSCERHLVAFMKSQN
jgi:hypothetical protein